MRAIKLMLVFAIVTVGVACVQSPTNDPSAGDLEIVVGDFDAAGTAEVAVTVMSPTSGDAQLFLDVVPGGGTLAQKEWNLTLEAGVPQTITTSIQIDGTLPAGREFNLAGDFMDVKSFVHQDVANIYMWPDGPRVLQPGEKVPTPATPPVEIREVTSSPL